MATIAAIFKFAQFIFWCVVLIPPQIIVKAFSKGKAAYVLPQFWHRRICQAFGLKVSVTGHPATDGQVIYVSNHVSYLDIPVVSTVLPASFVAKQEVAGWPLFGLLAKLQNTAFIDRARRNVKAGKKNLQGRIEQNDNLIIFPEGTSSDGKQVLPFKSALFSAALETEKKVQIQAFTIEVTEIDGQSIHADSNTDIYAWYGDMTLMPHFWNFAKSNGAKVTLHFHPPLQVKEEHNRKELAKTCFEMTSSGLCDEKAKAA